MDAYEMARLQAVEAAVKAALARPGAVTKAEIRAALAATPPPPVGDDPVTPNVEETV